MSGDLSTLLAAASAEQVAILIKKGDVSSLEVTRACLARIERFEHVHRAYISILKRQALLAARKSDAAIRRREILGPLHGVPVSVKDAFLMRGTITTVGSRLLHNFAPRGQRDATCVRKLRSAGAIILGKVGVGSGVTSADPDKTRLPSPRNPWHSGRTPGGSSSGSAVSVALGMGYASVGTDLGGSIRIPAAMSGVVGLKPTYGAVSLEGDVFGLCYRLEHVGPITRTVRDALIILDVLVEDNSRRRIRFHQNDRLTALGGRMQKKTQKPMRIAWAGSGGPAGAEADVIRCTKSSRRMLEEMGLVIEEIDLPVFDDELWHQIVLVDEWEAYDRHFGESRGYWKFIRARLRRNRQRMFEHVRGEIERVKRRYGELFALYDLIALPTAPITAKPFSQRTVRFQEEKKDLVDLFIANTWMFNVTGHPAISVPSGLSREGLPVGLQLVGKHFHEELLFNVGLVLERAVGGFALPQIVSIQTS